VPRSVGSARDSLEKGVVEAWVVCVPDIVVFQHSRAVSVQVEVVG
jgi:hypothetical protein